MSWYIYVIKNYIKFSGRASRKEFWMYTLVSFVIALVLALIDQLSGLAVFTKLYELFVLIPNLSVSFRRLHDINKSAWWLLISLIPVVGAIIILVFTVLPGTIGANNYGDDPRKTSIY